MALPKDVTDALMDMATVCPQEEVFGDRVANWLSPIREHLLSQDTEIERMQSRLAAANALLSRCFVQIGELTKGLDPHNPIYVELQQLGLDWMQHSEAGTAHLSENTHDRA